MTLVSNPTLSLDLPLLTRLLNIMKLLIDADYIVYKSCQVCETEIDFGDDVIVVTSKFSDAYKQTLKEINKIESNFFSSSSTILFFSDSVNFRKSVFRTTKDIATERNPADTDV